MIAFSSKSDTVKLAVSQVLLIFGTRARTSKLYNGVTFINRLGGWLAVWCSGNALVSINAVALHRARFVLGWVTAFGQVNCLIT